MRTSNAERPVVSCGKGKPLRSGGLGASRRGAVLIRQSLLLAAAALTFASSPASAQRQMEHLGRGVVAIQQPDGKVFVSWRVLGTDPEDIGFNLYRKSEAPPGRPGFTRRGFGGAFGPGQPVKLNDQPLTGSSWYLDSSVNLASRTSYSVRPVLEGKELEASADFVLPAEAPPLPWLTIPLKTISGYRAGDASAGDLDGDGEYEIVVMQTGRSRDNSQAGLTDPALLQAYRLDGVLLWEINLGRNIRGGAHYSPFVVYDLDGDGRGEIACKTADGTVDGTGQILGDGSANHVDAQGHVLRGPEFLTIFDGLTGRALATTDYVPGRHPAKQDPSPEELATVWGDGRGNRSERYLACAAYLDGVRPSLVMCRGYYTRAVLAAWDWRDGKLAQRWVFDTEAVPGNRRYRGQGNHSVSVTDVDDDGRDEIIYGAAVIDDNGTGLHSTGWGHGDAMHVSDLDPANPGQEIFSIQERFAGEGMNLRDGKTGRPLFLIPSAGTERSGRDPGEGPARGLSINIDPRHRGSESWAFGPVQPGIYDVRGNRIAARMPRSCNFAVWWDGDLLRELLDRNRVTKWNWLEETETTLLIAQGATSINGTKATPALSADLLGDWREEIVWPSGDGKELRLYTTTIPTPHRLPTLMHDPQYRLAIAWQNAGYNQPPHPSFYLDESSPRPPRANVTTVRPAAPAPEKE